MNDEPVKNSLFIGDLVEVLTKEPGAAVVPTYKSMEEIVSSSIPATLENLSLVPNSTTGIIVKKLVGWRGETGVVYGVLLSKSVKYINFKFLKLLKRPNSASR